MRAQAYMYRVVICNYKLCYNHIAIGAVLLAMYYKHCAVFFRGASLKDKVLHKISL